ncbi:MAG: SDR family NAD(P)-dependent oxidoreductase [Pirellulales bacterium]
MNASNPNTQGSGRPVALVTGAGRRVGNCIARTLAARGYRLVLHVNTSLAEAQATAAQLAAAGTEAVAMAADLRDAAAVRSLVGEAHRHFGRIDALVNSAAVWQRKRLEDIAAEDVRLHFEINTLGTFLFCREVGLIMVEQEAGGAIVNIGDWAVARPYPDYAAYFPSKGAIPTLTRDFAVELARRNPRVRVNAILPGPVLLPPEMSPEERADVVAATLVRREGRPQNIADAAAFLLENDYITGVCLPVDGGRTVHSA